MKISIDKHTLNWLKRKVNNVVSVTSTTENKSNIICSLMTGIPAPIITIEEVNDTYSVINGSEIVGTIIDFINGNFELQVNNEYKIELGNEINGKTYFDFSDDEKENFLDIEIIVGIASNITENQKNLLKTSMLNSNCPVEESETSAIDKYLDELLNHKFFESVNISSPSIDLVAQFLMVKEEGVTTELRVKDIILFKKTLTKKDCNLAKELDYLYKAYPEKTVYLKKTHVPMVYLVGKRALRDKIKPERFRKIMDNFFDNMSEEYRKNCDSSSSKSKANARIRAIMKYYNTSINKK